MNTSRRAAPGTAGRRSPWARADQEGCGSRLRPGAVQHSPPGWQSRSGSAGHAGGPAASAGAAPRCAGAAPGAPPPETHLRGGGGRLDTVRDTKTQRNTERCRQRHSKGERRRTPERTEESQSDTRGHLVARAPCVPRIPIYTQTGVCSGRPSPAHSPTDPPTPANSRTHDAPPTPSPPPDLSAHPPPMPCRGWGGDGGPGRWTPPGGQGPLARLPRSSPSGSTSAAMSAPPLRAACQPSRQRRGRGFARPRPWRRAPPVETPPAPTSPQAPEPPHLLCSSLAALPSTPIGLPCLRPFILWHLPHLPSQSVCPARQACLSPLPLFSMFIGQTLC